jgi:hypothetical protein
METWKPVPNAPCYQVSDLGRVRLSDGRISAAGRNSRGYPNVRLVIDGVSRTVYVHRLVAGAFLGPPPSAKHTHVAHCDGSTDNNRADNLRWATAVENSADRLRHGTAHFGERNPASKLSDVQRAEIRASVEGCKVLAERYGVSMPLIVKIRGRLRAPNRGHAQPPT